MISSWHPASAEIVRTMLPRPATSLSFACSPRCVTLHMWPVATIATVMIRSGAPGHNGCSIVMLHAVAVITIAMLVGQLTPPSDRSRPRSEATSRTAASASCIDFHIQQ